MEETLEGAHNAALEAAEENDGEVLGAVVRSGLGFWKQSVDDSAIVLRTIDRSCLWEIEQARQRRRRDRYESCVKKQRNIIENRPQRCPHNGGGGNHSAAIIGGRHMATGPTKPFMISPENSTARLALEESRMAGNKTSSINTAMLITLRR